MCSSWLCTPPGDSRPRMWTAVLQPTPCRPRRFRVRLLKNDPVRIERLTRVNSWYTTRPAPMLRCRPRSCPSAPTAGRRRAGGADALCGSRARAGPRPGCAPRRWRCARAGCLRPSRQHDQDDRLGSAASSRSVEVRAPAPTRRQQVSRCSERPRIEHVPGVAHRRGGVGKAPSAGRYPKNSVFFYLAFPVSSGTTR